MFYVPGTVQFNTNLKGVEVTTVGSDALKKIGLSIPGIPRVCVYRWRVGFNNRHITTEAHKLDVRRV